jgi:hypothetical protein
LHSKASYSFDCSFSRYLHSLKYLYSTPESLLRMLCKTPNIQVVLTFMLDFQLLNTDLARFNVYWPCFPTILAPVVSSFQTCQCLQLFPSPPFSWIISYLDTWPYWSRCTSVWKDLQRYLSVLCCFILAKISRVVASRPPVPQALAPYEGLQWQSSSDRKTFHSP